MASNAPKTGPVVPQVGPPPPGNVGGVPTDSPLGAILNIVGTLISDLNAAITESQNLPIAQIYNGLSQHVGRLTHFIAHDPTKIWQMMTEVTVGQFYKDMLELGLNVDTGKFDQLALDGIKTTDTILGFAYIMPFLTSLAELAGKLPLGGRWIGAALAPIGHLSEEMGLSWALGAQIESAYEAAVGESVLEGIREQKRSSRLDWPILRTALRQHALEHGDFVKYMRKLGFPEEQITTIEQLDRTQLTVGQLQQLWLMEEVSRSDFRQALRHQGFSEDDVNSLTTLMIDKAQTGSGALLRSTARQLAAGQLITMDQYRTILEQVKTPEREIKDDVQAITLEITHGHLQSSLTNLKNLYLRGLMDTQQLHQELTQLGYTSQAITDMIASWQAGPTPRPLSMAKILSYYVSGVLDEGATRSRLLAGGLKPADADLVIAHAKDVPRVRPHPLTPALVTQAYLDGALDPGEMPAAYARAGATGEVAQDYMASAVFRKSRQRRPAGATIPLTAGELLDAFEYGLIDPHTALDEMEHLGYSPEDALLKLEIKNKGPVSFAPAPRPDFASLQDAISYLEGQGYTVKAPPNPLVIEAEGIVWSHGYSVSPPANQLPSPIGGIPNPLQGGTVGGGTSGAGGTGGTAGGGGRPA